jgi:hypothetical protein
MSNRVKFLLGMIVLALIISITLCVAIIQGALAPVGRGISHLERGEVPALIKRPVTPLMEPFTVKEES